MKNNITRLCLFAFINAAIALSTQAAVTAIKSSEEYNSALKNGSFIVAKFYAKWCGVCKGIKEPFEELANDKAFTEIKFMAVDIDEQQDLAQKNNIAGIPTFIYYKNGKQVDIEVGVNDIENFKPNMEKKIKSVFNITSTKTEIETPEAQHVIEKKEPLAQEQLIKSEQQKSEPSKTNGIIDIIQRVIMGIINAIMSLLMGIVKMVKGFFGR